MLAIGTNLISKANRLPSTIDKVVTAFDESNNTIFTLFSTNMSLKCKTEKEILEEFLIVVEDAF